MSAFNMVPVSERLPEKHRQVLLIADRYWATPDGVPAMRVTATGYLSDFGHPHWSIFGERAMRLDAFCLWAYVNDQYQSGLERNEEKTKRIKAWLKESGRVEDAIEKSMITDGAFDEFAKEHIDGFAFVRLALYQRRRYLFGTEFDPDGLHDLVDGVIEEFIAENYEAFEEICLEDEWEWFE